MRERLETWLKIACVILAGLVVLQLGRAFVQSNPLARLRVPSPPELPADTNSPVTAKGLNAPAATPEKGSNTAASIALKSGTNLVSHTGTNASPLLEKESTNLASGQRSTNTASNSVPASIATASLVTLETTNQTTNIVSVVTPETTNRTTNVVPGRLEQAGTNLISTNAISAVADKAGTNKLALAGTAKSQTNSAAPPLANSKGMPAVPPEIAALMGMNPMGPKPPELPAATKATIDRITDSEILAPVIRPQPMALLGIAGDEAFLRAPNGQTGMIKENDSLGELKLLRIGINRVLVEQDGQKKELTIFSGYGGESLLPEPDKRNESTK